MKVLHIGIPNEPNAAIHRAFIECGHECETLAWGDVMRRHGKAGLQTMMLDSAKRMSPSLVFMQIQSPEVIERSTVDELRDMGAFVINWTGDIRKDIEWYKELAPHVDVTAFSNMDDVDTLRSLGLRSCYLQIGYDETIYWAWPESERVKRVVFTANNYGSFPQSDLRRWLVSEMRNTFGDAFEVYGGGWGEGVRILNPREEAELFRTSLLAINLDHFHRRWYTSDRAIRAQACGCAVIDVNRDGLEDEHPLIHRCYSVTDIPRVAAKIMKHPQRLTKRGERAALHTAANHRWHNRVVEIERAIVPMPSYN